MIKFKKRLVKLGKSSHGFVVPNYYIKAGVLNPESEYDVIIPTDNAKETQ